MSLRTRKRALVEGVAAGVLFGSAAIFVRFLPALDTFSIVFWRLAIACIALIVVVVLEGGFHIAATGRNARDIMILGLLLGLHFLFFVSALKDTTILNATVLVNVAPVFSALISSFMFKVKPSRFAMVGLVVSFVGICVMAYAEAVTPVVQGAGISPSAKGDLEAVVSALLIAFYVNWGRRIRSQTSAVSTMFLIYALGALIVGVLSLAVGVGVVALPSNLGILVSLVGLAVLPTAVAHTLYFSSLSNLKAFETAAMALLEPIGATILGVILFAEVPAYVFAVGASLVLLGIFFIVKEKA
jgi:drug/metabolite transporter (DMT)-like permease